MILLISVGLFISNFQHFVHSAIFMFLVQLKLAWSSLFSSPQEIPRPSMIVHFTSYGLHPSCMDIKSKGTRQMFIFARKSTDVRCKMFISFHIKNQYI